MFESPGYYAREVTIDEIPRVQALFEANPEYSLSINGYPPLPDAAQSEFDDDPPSHLGFTRRWFTGLFDHHNEMIGVTAVVSDLCAAHVWHVALFLIATRFHGHGVASEIYASLEDWMRQSGAKWVRLGVVESNDRANRFWAKHGFREVRTRGVVDTAGRLNTIRVLVKSLEASGIADYLALVPRDQPDSMLP